MIDPDFGHGVFPLTNCVGDPGRQPGIRPTSGPLDVGLPDTALDFLSLGDLEVRGCSSRGWKHRFSGSPRQDSYSILANEEFLVVAVADGVSEGEYSQVAADTAARSACKLIADQMARSGAIDWVQLSRRLSLRVIEESEYRRISTDLPPSASTEERLRACQSKMATTLIVAVVGRRAEPLGIPVEIAVVAGDSAAYLILDGEMTPLLGGKSDVGTITSNGVRPLPGPVDVATSRILLPPGAALILGTDGIGDLVDDGSGEMGTELASRWATPPTADRFLLDVNTFRRSFDDDRTAVTIWVNPTLELPDAPAEPDPSGAPAHEEITAGLIGDADSIDEQSLPDLSGPDNNAPEES